MADLLSQYAEEVETFRHVFDLPDPRETMPRSSTSVLGDRKGQQELRPRGPSSMLPLSADINVPDLTITISDFGFLHLRAYH